MIRRARRQRGDTIIEVLICVGVVGAVLAGAFVVTNRSQLGVRDAQERSEAAKIVEGQLELLRSNAKLQRGTVFKQSETGDTFCMDRVTATPIRSQGPDNPAAGCKINSLGEQSNSETAYSMAITRVAGRGGIDGAGQLFRIHVSWESVTGSTERAQETMYYRLYP